MGVLVEEDTEASPFEEADDDDPDDESISDRNTATHEFRRSSSVRVADMGRDLSTGYVDAEVVPDLLGAAATEQRNAEMAELMAAAEARDKVESARAKGKKLPTGLFGRLSHVTAGSLKGAKEAAGGLLSPVRTTLSRPSMKKARARLTRATLAIKVDKLDLVGRLLAYR
jgi:hypothetical protein